MKRDTIPHQILDRVDEELLAGEELLWAGRPSGLSSGTVMGGTPMMAGISLMVIIGLLMAFGGAALARGAGASAWVLFLILIVAVMVAFAPILKSILRNRSTVYAVTDRRALIIGENSVQSYGPRDIEFIERRMHSGGRGDILFAREVHSSGAAMWGPGGFSRRAIETSVGFFGIEDARAVEALMLEVFRPVEVYGGEKPKRDEAEAEDNLPLDAEAEIEPHHSQHR
jgi:hypothetical protein